MVGTNTPKKSSVLQKLVLHKSVVLKVEDIPDKSHQLLLSDNQNKATGAPITNQEIKQLQNSSEQINSGRIRRNEPISVGVVEDIITSRNGQLMDIIKTAMHPYQVLSATKRKKV